MISIAENIELAIDLFAVCVCEYTLRCMSSYPCQYHTTLRDYKCLRSIRVPDALHISLIIIVVPLSDMLMPESSINGRLTSYLYE